MLIIGERERKVNRKDGKKVAAVRFFQYKRVNVQRKEGKAIAFNENLTYNQIYYRRYAPRFWECENDWS